MLARATSPQVYVGSQPNRSQRRARRQTGKVWSHRRAREILTQTIINISSDGRESRLHAGRLRSYRLSLKAGRLLDRQALRKIPRLIDVRTLEDGDVIGKQLHRNGEYDGGLQG
jgi:hypothetical protein